MSISWSDIVPKGEGEGQLQRESKYRTIMFDYAIVHNGARR